MFVTIWYHYGTQKTSMYHFYSHVPLSLPFWHCPAVIQKQMRLREARTWQLRDLLGLAGELPTFADPSQDENTWYTPIYKIQNPTLVCSKKPRLVDLTANTGLPSDMPPEETAALWRAIRIASSGENPVLTWTPPIRCASQMKLTLPDYQELPGSPRRLMQQTLRALPEFQGKPALDYVKMDVDMDGHYRSYFARCVCFFVDSHNIHFIAVRWLTEVPGVVIDGTTLLPPLTMSPPGNTKSYSVMPATSMQNGALVLAAGNKLWPLFARKINFF